MAPHQLERALTGRDPLLVVILGPTGSGKTALALEIAQRFNGEVVNCDSVALYREFTIGTAKPTSEEQARVPHHLLDVVEPTEPTTAGEYSRWAREILGEIHVRENMPIVVGGTGLYLRALIDGLFPGPQRSEEIRERLRARVEEKSPQHLHRILKKLDPAAAKKIHANDTPKLIRAIEVCLSTRQPMTEQWQAGRDALSGFRVLRIGLEPDRARLYERINSRVLEMFETGLVEETKHLFEKYGKSALPLRSIGYKQVAQHLKGEVDLRTAVAAVQQAHRNYAKRQMTWFRREPEVVWLHGFGNESDIQAQAVALVTERKHPVAES